MLSVYQGKDYISLCPIVGLRTFNEVFGLLANTCRWQVKGGKVIADGSNVDP